MKKMCRFLFAMMAIALLLSACATSSMSKQEKRKIQEVERLKIADKLEKRHFTIDVDKCYPERMGVITLTSLYEVTVAGDTLKSYLPFFGRAYSVPYGGGKGLIFDAPITRFDDVADGKNPSVSVYASNTEDSYHYIITVTVGGYATVRVLSQNRSPIEFSGRLRDDEKMK